MINKLETHLFSLVVVLILLLAAASSFSFVFSIIGIVIIDIYLIWLLFASAYLSTPYLITNSRREKILKSFPSRPMGLLLFILFLIATGYMFSNIYFSLNYAFCSDNMSLQNRIDSVCFSVSIITTVNVVNFAAMTTLAKLVVISQLASDILLLIAAFPLLLSRISNFEDVPQVKRAPFNSKEQTVFNEENIERLTGLPPDKWREFSGLFTDTIPEIAITKNAFSFSGTYPELKMETSNDKRYFNFTFHLDSDCIYVDHFVLPDSAPQGIAIRAFIRFTRLAKHARFKKIECVASKSEDGKPHLGFIVWAKFGFTMTTESHNKFLEKVKKDERFITVSNIQELLNTEGGEGFWQIEGFDWDAIFDLSSTSLNWQIWTAYSMPYINGNKSLS